MTVHHSSKVGPDKALCGAVVPPGRDERISTTDDPRTISCQRCKSIMRRRGMMKVAT